MTAISGDRKRSSRLKEKTLDGYNFAYLDDQTKRMIRRATLKAVAIPGYQVPFGSREMPLPFGWGTGGIQVTANLEKVSQLFKKIDIFIRGESEFVILEILNKLNQPNFKEQILGISFKDQNNKLITNSKQDLISNLDSIPVYDYSIFDNFEDKNSLFLIF